MRLHRVRLWNFRGVRECDVAFATTGVTIVEGPNEAGKTTIAEALQLVLDEPDSAGKKSIKAVKPADRDEGPEAEITLSAGAYEFVYRKRWLRRPETTLTVTAPRGESLTGREAHDRVKAILDETLDEQLWRALRIEQGTELALPAFNTPSLGSALDLAAAGPRSGDREDSLWERICDEHLVYWTATGREKGDRKESRQEVAEAREQVASLEQQLANIDSDVEEMGRLVSEASSLATTQKECAEQEAQLAEQWDEVERSRGEIERLKERHVAATAQRDAAAADHERRQELIGELDRRSDELAALEEKAEQAAPARAVAAGHRDAASSALDAAGIALRAAEEAHRLAVADRDHLRNKIEVEQLRERRERYLEAETTLREAVRHLDSARVDDDLVARIERAFLDHERAKAASDSSAAAVETTALGDVTLTVGGEQIRMVGGEVRTDPVEDEAVFQVGEIARLRVSAGPDSRTLAERRAAAHAVYRQLCDRGGVADLAEARSAAQQRQQAERDRAEADTAIKRELRDLTPDVLLGKVETLYERVAAYPDQRPADPPLPADFEAAKKAAGEAESALEAGQAEHTARSQAAAKASDALQEYRTDEQVLQARIEDARGAKAQASRALSAARDEQPDEALVAAVVAAGAAADETGQSLEEAEAEMEAADPESLQARLENARAAAERAARELAANEDRRRELRISLDLRGEEGLHTRLDEARTRLARLEGSHQRGEARAAAARLLHEVFDQHRRQARQRYAGPFRERIEEFGRIVFGSTFEVGVDDDLRVVRRTLNGVTLDVDQLSTGAREQIGVVSRLACAAIVSPDDGGVPVMIDDALGWSDPGRLQKMGAAIASAGKHCQIVVLTCTPGRYAAVGNAQVVRL